MFHKVFVIFTVNQACNCVLTELVHWLCTHLPLLISKPPKSRFSNFYESDKRIPTFPIMQPNNIIGMSTSLKNKEYVLGEGRGDPERHHPSVFSYVKSVEWP